MSEDYWKLKGAVTEFETYWNEKNRDALKQHWDIVERLAKKSPYSTILDIGCGVGNLIAFTSLATEENYLGIDISPPMIERARTLHPEYRFEVANPMEFSTPSDLVVANGFLLHQHDLFLKLHRLTELTKNCLIFNVMVTREGASKRNAKGYWTRFLGDAEYAFMKGDLGKISSLEEVKFGEWVGTGGVKDREYYIRCDRTSEG